MHERGVNPIEIIICLMPPDSGSTFFITVASIVPGLIILVPRRERRASNTRKTVIQSASVIFVSMAGLPEPAAHGGKIWVEIAARPRLDIHLHAPGRR
jgi:hypothetical protein